MQNCAREAMTKPKRAIDNQGTGLDNVLFAPKLSEQVRSLTYP